jgi:hypothetical protein
MKPQNLHAHEDRLLDFAYGELPAQEARVVESHLQGCTRCTELLEGMRGVRSTMAQLPLEPAPDAGLESLLAYAQQAARNAAAGPPLKPTWWRRWLVPVMGVTAVSLFGIVSLQVSKTVDLSPEVMATAERSPKKAEAAAVASTPPAPAMLAEAAPPPPPEAKPAAPAEAMPLPEPVAKADSAAYDKLSMAPRKKAMKPSSTYGGDADWSNAGAGRALERDSFQEKSKKDYAYDRRDAMTQSGAFSKPKPMLVSKGSSSASSTPAPVQAAPPPPAAAQPGAAPADEGMEEGASMDDVYAAEAQVQQQGPSRSSLQLGGSRRGAAEAAAKEAEAPVVASLDSARPSEAKREQRARAPEAASAPQAAGAPAPTGRSERQGPSPAELSKLALEAMRSDNRVREAQLLRLALEAGATGKERLGLLNRLCDAEFAIGRREAAIQACSLVLEEAPRSSAAQVARRRLNQDAPPASPNSRFSAPKSSAPLNADEVEMPASAPAESR